MGGNVLVRVESVSKKFCRNLKRSLWYGVQDIAGEMLARDGASRLRREEFWALEDVSFELRRGESLGIIGPNGAGKTTLLRLLNGLIKPDAGSMRMRGRTQALISLGAGFSPILTGRENIYVNAAVLGIPKREVDRRLDQIIDFAEVGDFIDTPVQSYSSGMQVRLGFAVAIHVNPDVLIIDEVLAVGDQRFRRKARNAMARLLESDIALIFVSHNMHEVLGITQRALWLDKGRVVKLADTPTVCSEYVYQAQYDGAPGGETAYEYMNKRTGDLAVREVSCWVGEQQFGRNVDLDGRDGRLVIELTMEAQSAIDEPTFHMINLRTRDGARVAYVAIKDHIAAGAGAQVIRRFAVDVDFLHPGSYQIAYELGTEGGPRLEAIENLVYLGIGPAVRPLPDRGGDGELHYARMSDNDRGAAMLPARLVR